MAGTPGSRAALTLALSIPVLFVAVACNRDGLSAQIQAPASKATPAGKQAGLAPMRGEWRLVAIDEQLLSAGGTPTVVFGDEGDCWGDTGVNNFHTSFKLQGVESGQFEVGAAAVTRRGGPPEAMALENLFLERLQSARTFETDGNRLYLHSGGDQHLTFERVIP